MNIEVIHIQNKDYYLVKSINIKDEKYLCLVNKNDPQDIIIRKELIENNESFLVGLDNNEEFDLVMNELYKEVR